MSCHFELHKNSNLFYDNCNLNYKDNVNKTISNYFIKPIDHITKGDVSCIELSQPIIQSNNAPGWNEKNMNLIDVDSSFRNSARLTNVREIHQLNHDQYFNVPYLARGKGDSNLESKLRTGEEASQPKSCNSFAGEDMSEYNFTPLLDNVKEKQNPAHIIPEMCNKVWKRGGVSSRDINKCPVELNKCGFRHNGKFWEKK